MRASAPFVALVLALLPAVPALAVPPEAAPAPRPVQADVPAAVRSAFPGADRIDADDVLLTDAMARTLSGLARSSVEDRLVTFYTARAGAGVAGYAALQSHVVRTKRETLLVLFEPDGRLRRVSVVSFLEPPEYKPSERWLDRLAGKGVNDRLAVGDDVAPITGATLSARGVAERSRWLLQALKMAREAGRVR